MGIQNTAGALDPFEIIKLQARRELRAIFVLRTVPYEPTPANATIGDEHAAPDASPYSRIADQLFSMCRIVTPDRTVPTSYSHSPDDEFGARNPDNDKSLIRQAAFSGKGGTPSRRRLSASLPMRSQ